MPRSKTHRFPATLLVAAVLTLPSLLPGADPPGPAPTREQVLKTFVEELVPLTPGEGKFPASFTMGSSDAKAPAAEKPAVKVTFKSPFAISRYEVTQELYQHVMGKNPSKWTGRRNSVEMVSWDEANEFCKKLTAELRKMKLIGADEVIRLPSEAEWEYACRAGTTTAWSFGDKEEDLGAHAWYNKNSKGYDPPVGQKKPNPWGLYDMHDYIWEWCADAWSPSHEGADPAGGPRSARPEDAPPAEKAHAGTPARAPAKQRVIRSGSWGDSADASRSAFRQGEAVEARSDRIGFRCVKAKEKP